MVKAKTKSCNDAFCALQLALSLIPWLIAVGLAAWPSPPRAASADQVHVEFVLPTAVCMDEIGNPIIPIRRPSGSFDGRKDAAFGTVLTDVDGKACYLFLSDVDLGTLKCPTAAIARPKDQAIAGARDIPKTPCTN